MQKQPLSNKISSDNRSWLMVIVGLFIIGFISIILVGIIGLFLSFPSSDMGITGKGNIAVIAVDGPIVTTDGKPFSGAVAVSSDVVKLIEKAKKEASIKGVLFSINSPGGSAVASDEISNAIKELRDANKTSAAMIRDMGTSGAYWIAVSTDHIIAHPASFTGSIGVISSYVDLFEKYGLTYQRLVAGDMKDIGSPYKHMAPGEEAVFQQSLDELHDVFIKHIADSRGMQFGDVKNLATGVFYTGTKAKDLGLVDELGSRKEAENYFKNRLNVNITFVDYKKPRGFFETLAEGLSEQSFSVGQGIGYALRDSSVVDEISVRV